MMKKLLVTGTTGFIGRHLAHALRNDYHVLAPTRQELDLLNTRVVREYLSKNRVDIVLHCAVQRTFSLPEICAQSVLQNNLRMFYNLEQCSEHYEKMICIGSGAEYGKKFYQPLMSESYFGETVPDDAYGLSKYVISKTSMHSRNIYVLRAFGVFGPYEDYNHRFISNTICKMLLGQTVVIHQNVRFDYIYIDDFCKLVQQFLEISPRYRDYNLCTGKPIEILSIAQQIRDILHATSRILVEASEMGKEYSGANSRLFGEIDALKFLPMRDALMKLISFYQQQEIKLEGDY